ncbi:MAG: hypothetical protein QM495_08110 [Lutibacter sp.]|uniref:hypothetical protein n=1 Tax=Lutibacter sp. TaxID=1925666 RepID=UPI00385DA524
MKNDNYIKQTIFTICILFFGFSSVTINAKSKKLKARISIQYIKESGQNNLAIAAKYKEGKLFKMGRGFKLKVYSVMDNDSLVFLEDVVLNPQGKFNLNINKAFEKVQKSYTFKVIFAGSEKFKKAKKTITIKIANLTSKLIISKDKKYSIEATLTDVEGNPIPETEVNVQLDRLFSPLPVGNGIYFTNENGTIVAPIKEIMPGINGKLNYEVLLKDNDDYGTIKSVVKTAIGKEIKDLSTFDQRTMWSPPTMAPWADLIVPNLLILGIWGTLVILVINLFRISKHKNS